MEKIHEQICSELFEEIPVQIYEGNSGIYIFKEPLEEFKKQIFKRISE